MIKLTIVRLPRSGALRHRDIHNEVRTSLAKLGEASAEKLTNELEGWNEKPTFKSKAIVSSKRWALTISVSEKGKIGKIYKWVDKGTGSRGGNEAYVIRPLRKDGMLAYVVPHHPFTLPNPTVPGFPPTGPEHLVMRKEVIHPGIYPRNFTKTMVETLKGRKPGSFNSVVNAAVKRALRRRSNGG